MLVGMANEGAVDRARALIAEAERILGVTGAGISTDSGIRDFRGPQGVWTKNPEAEKLSNIEYYVSDPEIRKRAWRRRVESPALDAEPNPGHHAFVALERQGRLHHLVTQNVDGLHLKAGNSAELVTEIHGTTREVGCLDCGDRAPIERAIDRVRAGEEDPACKSCGGILKVATISFGQQLVALDIMRAERAAQTCDLALAVGSTLSVYPAAGVVPVARHHGARVVILNGEETAMDHIADVVVRGSISELLPKLVVAG